MKQTLAVIFLSVSVVRVLAARPAVFPKGIVNAASFKPAGLPGSSIAPGSLFSLFGTDLGPIVGVSASSFPLQSVLAGVSLRVTPAGGTGVDAIPVYVSSSQINAILPSNAPLGPVSLTVTFQNQTSDPAPVQVVSTSFGIISRTSDGTGQGLIQNLLANGSTPLNTLSNPARAGQVMIAYGTGLGAISGPDNTAPPVADFNLPVQILVGGRPARKLYAGRSPCCAGLDQINLEVPADAPTGCYVPVTINAGRTYSNYVTIAVASGNGACDDASNPLAGAIAGAGTHSVGSATLQRSVLALTTGLNAVSTIDTASAFFLRVGETFFHSDVALPPPGACWVQTFRASAGQAGLPLPLFSLRDAGSPLRLTGPSAEKTIPREALGTYFAELGGGIDLPGQPPAPPAYLVQGRYTVVGPGGADIGAISANLDVPDPATWTPTWTHRDQTTVVNRSQPLQVNWNVGDASRGVALISGSSTDASLGIGGTFTCMAPLAPGSFSVPIAVLGSLPASGSQAGTPSGMLSVGTLVNGPSFNAPGLDTGLLRYRSTVSRLVSYQ